VLWRARKHGRPCLGRRGTLRGNGGSALRRFAKMRLVRHPGTCVAFRVGVHDVQFRRMTNPLAHVCNSVSQCRATQRKAVHRCVCISDVIVRRASCCRHYPWLFLAYLKRVLAVRRARKHERLCLTRRVRLVREWMCLVASIRVRLAVAQARGSYARARWSRFESTCTWFGRDQ
jgi:hypothetical protein